jgi:hypothetical protein
MRPRTAVGAALSRNLAIHYRFAVALAVALVDSFSYYSVLPAPTIIGEVADLSVGSAIALGPAASPRKELSI